MSDLSFKYRKRWSEYMVARQATIDAANSLAVRMRSGIEIE
jgi:hypothetical protein